MRHEIIFAEQAVEDLRALTARGRTTIKDAIEVHLRHQPEKVSKSRIKRLRGLRKPQYRLRIDDYRVFYDVRNRVVEVLAIVSRSAANEILNDIGVQE